MPKIASSNERSSGGSMTTVFRATDKVRCLKLLCGDNIFATRFKGEAAFDRITTLAARLFDVPIALVSLVDNFRDWFKSGDRLLHSPKRLSNN